MFTLSLKAQDPMFSLFESNAMNFNPAHVGNEDFSRLALGYRNDYPNYKSPFVTTYASYDMYVDNINSGFGLMIMSDNVAKGVFKTTTISAAYSYNLQLGEDLFLRGGLSASFVSRKRDPNGLIFPDMPEFNGNLSYISDYDVLTNSSLYVSAGGALMYKRFKMGAALFNFGGKSLSRSSLIKFQQPIRVTAYATIDIPLAHKLVGRQYERRDVLTLSPYIRYMRQYAFEDLDVGAYLNFEMFFLGLAQRSDTKLKNATYVIGAGFKTKWFNIGYSANFGSLGSDSRYVSAHEVNLTIKFADKKSNDLNGIYMNRRTTDSQRNRNYKCPY